MFPALSLARSQLTNGMPVVSEMLPDLRSAVVGVWVRFGSHSESSSTSGISHFLEHLLFKGTKSRTAEEISLEIDFVGGDLDAFTGRESTCYYIRVLPEHLEVGLELLCDVVLHPAFDLRELEKEKEVVLQEIRQAEDNPDDAVGDLLSQAMLPGQPFGFPVLGSPEVISALDRQDLEACYRQAYRPEAMFITASGNIDRSLLLGELERHFADALPSPTESLSSDETDLCSSVPVYRAGRVAQSRDIQQAHLCLGLPGVTQQDDHKYALSLVETALGGGVSSRLFQEIREKRGLAYSVSSFMAALGQMGTFGVEVATTLDHVDDLVEIIESELASLRKHGLTENELQRAKNQARGALLMGLETPGSRMMALGRCLLYFDRIISAEETLQKLDGISVADTAVVSERVFKEDAESWALIGPLASAAEHPRLLKRGFQQWAT